MSLSENVKNQINRLFILLDKTPLIFVMELQCLVENNRTCTA